MTPPIAAHPYIQGNVWFVGDLHLGHANIIRYCNRPFASIEEHDTVLLAQWREYVKPNDVMFHVGDLALGRPEKLLPKIAELTGNLVYLLGGNHDERALKKLENAGSLPEHVRVLRMHRDQPFELRFGAHRVVLTHHPLDELPEGVALNVHGHCHGKSRRSRTTHLDVSWDVFRRPLRWQEIRDIIEGKEPSHAF